MKVVEPEKLAEQMDERIAKERADAVKGERERTVRILTDVWGHASLRHHLSAEQQKALLPVMEECVKTITGSDAPTTAERLAASRRAPGMTDLMVSPESITEMNLPDTAAPRRVPDGPNAGKLVVESERRESRSAGGMFGMAEG